MGKLLKPLVVILLLVNAGAAYLGFMVFEQREAIKAATLLQSKALADVAVNLDDEEIASDARKNLKVDLSDPAAIAPALEQITNLATIKQQNIVELQGDLAAEKTARQQTERELAGVKSELETTRGDLETAEDALSSTKTKLADAEAKVGGLSAEIADLKSNVDSLEGELKDSEGTVADLNAEIGILKVENEKLFALTPAGINNRAPSTEEIRKLTGTVIAARPDFNFLVVDLGSDKGLQSNLEALIHRDKKLIARVKITRVDAKFAIADILPDWRLGDVTLGDKVMFDLQ